MVTAAFFDVDRTVLEGSSLLALVKPLRHEGLLPLPTVMRAGLRQLWFELRGYDDEQIDRAAAAAAAAVAGMDAASLNALGRAAMPEFVMPRIYPEARAEIAAHKAAGRLVFLVSAAPIEIVEELGRELGVDGVAATVSEIDAQGRYTGRILSHCRGPAKAEALTRLAAQHGIDLSGSFAYGDSVNDVPMLSSVGHPIAVNPDSRLSKVARLRNWPVQRYARRFRGPGAVLRSLQELRPPRDGIA